VSRRVRDEIVDAALGAVVLLAFSGAALYLVAHGWGMYP
jgi:hypothetical protein